VILLTDQCYPGVYPAHGPAICLKIVRREFGNHNQLVAELSDLARGKVIEKESLILIFCGTHMARVGTVAYTEGLTMEVAAIKSLFGQEVSVGPLPPLFFGGCTNKAAIRIDIDINPICTILDLGI
jgi:hypothetical protein